MSNSDVRKTILRNPEVPLRERQAKRHQEDCRVNKESKEQRLFGSEYQYHEPRINKMKELKDNLANIKLYQAEKMNTPEMKANSHRVANREVK
jgi:hypothetical protein